MSAGAAKIEPVDLEPSLSLCTHLVYGYAVIDGNTNRLTPMDDYVDLDTNKGYYRLVTALKARHPGKAAGRDSKYENGNELLSY